MKTSFRLSKYWVLPQSTGKSFATVVRQAIQPEKTPENAVLRQNTNCRLPRHSRQKRHNPYAATEMTSWYGTLVSPSMLTNT